MLKPILGITMGDAAGIGPELILKACGDSTIHDNCRIVLIASQAVMDYYGKQQGFDIKFNPIQSLDEAAFSRSAIDILDDGFLDGCDFKPGVLDARLGQAAVQYTQQAGRLTLSGELDAMVSAPLNKESMRMAGYTFEGQTQILAELCNVSRFGMILLLEDIRVMMLTTHMSLRDACDAVKKEKILNMIELADDSLRTFGISQPRITVAALNPHAGENGLFGREEVEQTVPAIQEACRNGINATGPVPADVVFVKAREGEYDLVLAMYHDQANMAAKLMGFGEVVTVLAGLPIIRTSVGHGTAFDIAGKGVADARNFIKAIEAAAQLAAMKKET